MASIIDPGEIREGRDGRKELYRLVNWLRRRVSSVSGAVPDTRIINATFPIRIDGGASASLAADRTISINLDAIAWDMSFLYSGRNFSVELPPLRGGADPNFWLRPFTSYETGFGDFATQDQVCEWEAGGAFSSVVIDVFVYQVAVTTTFVSTSTVTFAVTLNGTDIGGSATQTMTATNATTSNTRLKDTQAQAIVDGDRVGIRFHVTADDVGDAYVSGAMRASARLRLIP